MRAQQGVRTKARAAASRCIQTRRPRPRLMPSVLHDLELVDVPSLTARAQIATKLNTLIASEGLTQMQAALRLRMPQSKISAIRNYKLRGISLERLLDALVSLGHHVEITVRRRSTRQRPSVEVSS